MAKLNTDVPRRTGKWLRADVPHTGWRCVEIQDGRAICEMCEVTQIAYVHVMEHDRYLLPLSCGCICAGFMTEDPATEHLREVLYKWRKMRLAEREPIEKLRRNGWHRNRYGWSFSLKSHGSRVSLYHYFNVEISNTDGWRYHLFHPGRTLAISTELVRSEPFSTDLLAATAGIAHAEMLMADRLWVAADCEAEAECWAARKAEQLAREARSAIRRAREEGREDVCAAVEAGRLTGYEAFKLMFAGYLSQEERASLTEKLAVPAA